MSREGDASDAEEVGYRHETCRRLIDPLQLFIQSDKGGSGHAPW